MKSIDQHGTEKQREQAIENSCFLGDALRMWAIAHRRRTPKRSLLYSGPLIAAMRCYIASKLGDEIEIPKELK